MRLISKPKINYLQGWKFVVYRISINEYIGCLEVPMDNTPLMNISNCVKYTSHNPGYYNIRNLFT